jgi:diguanylate cyclase (GGDEF)-like protein/excisionase family DNA binding protein
MLDPQNRSLAPADTPPPATTVAAADEAPPAALDPLTGLPGREAFDAGLRRALSHTPGAAAAAVVVIGIDQLPRVVDALGPRAAEEVLRTTAGRLRRLTGAEATLARLAGDTFAVLVAADEPQPVAQTLAQDALAAAAAPIVVAGQELLLSASAGIAFTDPSRIGADEVVRDAATAQHRAQRRGGGRVEVFEPEWRNGLVEDLRMESELRSAITYGQELQLFYQPIVSLETGTVVAVEALVRWDHPRHGLLLPSRFLGVAERAGVLAELDRWMMAEACRQLASWLREHGPKSPPRVSINVSADELSDPEFATDVAAELRRWGLVGSQLVVEVAQTALRHSAGAATRLSELRSLGVSVLLDDFGTGYASLSYLRRLPMDGLKIERSFVEDLTTSAPARAIVDGVLEIGRAMGLSVVAVGVETAEQLEALRELGCNAGQGLHFLGPVPPATLMELFALSNQPMADSEAPLRLSPSAGPTAAEEELADAGQTMTLGQAAALLSISSSTLRRWADDGRVPTVRTSGGHRRFRLSELRQLAPPTPSVRLRAPKVPDTPVLPAALLLSEDGPQLVDVACRSIYEGSGGWFARDDARVAVDSWIRSLADAFRSGSYLSLSDAARELSRRAQVGGASLAEQHAFLERFGAAVRRGLAQRDGSEAEQVAVARTMAALAHQLLDDAEL